MIGEKGGRRIGGGKRERERTREEHTCISWQTNLRLRNEVSKFGSVRQEHQLLKHRAWHQLCMLEESGKRREGGRRGEEKRQSKGKGTAKRDIDFSFFFCSVVCTVASRDPQLVAGKIIARLIQVCLSALFFATFFFSSSLFSFLHPSLCFSCSYTHAHTYTHHTQMISSTANSSNNIATLDSHESWSSVTVVLRLLFLLSFENLLHVQQYLPELLHLIMLLFATGTSDIRATTHGLLVNVIHALYTIKGK